MAEFVDLARVDRIGLDTETTGVTYDDRPVGLSVSLPDGSDHYYRWGHEMGGNNCSKREVLRWVKREVNRSDLTVFMHSAGFDLRMLAYELGHEHPFPRARVEETGFMAALLNELEPDLTLDGLGQRHVEMEKEGDELWDFCSQAFGGGATRKAQAKNIWRAHGDVVEPYAKRDSRITLGLGDHLGPRLGKEGLADVYEMELQLIPILLRMHMVGVPVDVNKALALKDKLGRLLTRAERKWESDFGDVSYTSTAQLATLFDKLGLPYRRNQPTEKMLEKGITEGNASITKDDLKYVQHPVAEAITRMKKLKHFKGTFIDNYVLANVDPNGVIHGEFHPLRNPRFGTRSGRFSSGGGLNLQNVPAWDEEWAPLIRGLYVPASRTQVWEKADYCLVGETMVETLTGPRRIDSLTAGDRVFTWHAGRVSWGEVSRWARIGRAPTFKVTLDNEGSFTATGDHEMVLRDGGKVRVEDLRPGVGLAAFRRGSAGAGYETVYSASAFEYRYTHDLVAEAYHGPKPVGAEVHHVDEAKRNNSPRNLAYVDQTEHRALHAFKTVDEQTRLRVLRSALRRRRSYAGKGNPNWRGGKEDQTCVDCGDAFYQWPSQVNVRCVSCRRCGAPAALNHRVVSVEPAGERVVYHVTVEGDHNFALSCGVFSKNSQIEFRYLAHYAGGQLARAYNEDPDIDFHQMCAELVGIPRRPAKNINFGIVYGMGKKLMAAKLGVSLHEAALLLEEYHDRLPEVSRLYNRADRRANQRGYIVTWGGRKRRFEKRGRGYAHTHKALNALLQGSAADLMKKAMISVADGLDWETTPMHLTVHDELDFSVPREKRARARFNRVLREKMEDFQLRVPVVVDIEFGEDWGSCKPAEEGTWRKRRADLPKRAEA